MVFRHMLVTALAPLVWGSTYIVTSTILPPDRPITAACLRVLPVGLLMVLGHRHLPKGAWWGRALVLGALNIALFQAALFVAAYRLPGGVAATLGAIQPLLVGILVWPLVGIKPRPLVLGAGLLGVAGVATLVLTPQAALDGIGVAAALGGAACMALGMALTLRWRPPVSMLVFTSWQLVAGGVLLAPAALWFEPALPPLSLLQVGAYAYLGLIGAGIAYVLWFRGLTVLPAATVSALGLLSPVSATLLGWVLAGQGLGGWQWAGAGLVLTSVWLTQKGGARK
ncbi:MAG: ABC transporter permease [Magnetospirillum sp. 64-120]|nr:MAG: ABC transporter permease [Magnetospirillum sp. 64-120]